MSDQYVSSIMPSSFTLFDIRIIGNSKIQSRILKKYDEIGTPKHWGGMGQQKCCWGSVRDNLGDIDGG